MEPSHTQPVVTDQAVETGEQMHTLGSNPHRIIKTAELNLEEEVSAKVGTGARILHNIFSSGIQHERSGSD